MTEQYTIRRAPTMGQTDMGMARFFSPENLDRYRALASLPISPGERQQIISKLAQEMGALKAERKKKRLPAQP